MDLLCQKQQLNERCQWESNILIMRDMVVAQLE